MPRKKEKSLTVEQVIESNPDTRDIVEEVVDHKARDQAVLSDALEDLKQTPATIEEVPKEEETPKKKRKRRTKAQIEAEKNAEQVAEAQGLRDTMTSFTGIALEIFNRRMPNPVPVTEEEKQLMGDAVNRVMDKYLPTVGEWTPELTLALAVGVFAYPRIKHKEQRKLPPLQSPMVAPPSGGEAQAPGVQDGAH